MKKNITDWKSGRVDFWDMDFIDVNQPLSEQLSDLKEDLAQIKFPNDFLIDVGWYPEFSKEGSFLVMVIKNKDWDEPLMQERCSTIQKLLSTLDKAIAIAENFHIEGNK